MDRTQGIKIKRPDEHWIKTGETVTKHEERLLLFPQTDYKLLLSREEIYNMEPHSVFDFLRTFNFIRFES
jgi:hypothetical protein